MPIRLRFILSTTMRCASCLLPFVAVSAMAEAAVPASGFYRLQHSVALKSARPDWDYLSFDQQRGRLFMARRADGVAVYDARAGKRLPDIADSAEANATVLIESLDRGYTINGDGTATAFTLSTLKTLSRTRFGSSADSAVFEPATQQVLVMMGDDQAIAFLDARSGEKQAVMPVESHKLDGAASDGAGHVFVAARDRNAVLKIDAKQRRVVVEWKTGCDEPTGLAIDTAHARLLVGCRGREPVLAVLDTNDGKIVAKVEIGRGNDAVIYDDGKVYTANGVDGNLVIYRQQDADHYVLEQAVTTRPYARTMAMDRSDRKLYLVTAEGVADPSRKINRGPAPFYPNDYYADTFTLLVYAPQAKP